MAQEIRKQIRYKVFFTPKATVDTYGSEIDVSDKIDASGVKAVRKSIDAGDYQLGVYTTDDITITGHNVNGIFNDENDSRSIFPAGRDLAKVRLVFSELDDEGEETATVAFRGLINEEATRIEFKQERIRFRVLANDSVIRNTKVAAGLINDGTLFSDAMFFILNQTRITSVLTVSEANINPKVDLAIDDGSVFDDLESREALNLLLQASNSVLLIDSSENVIVQSRDEDTTKAVLELFGKSDQFGRENIVDVTRYNSGRHRMFTSVKIGNQERSNSGFEQEFGSRRKNFDFDFMTTDTKQIEIADNILDEFKAPKIELGLTVRTAEVKSVDLLDRVSVNYPLRLALPEGAKFLPVIGITEVNDSDEPLPRQFGSISIPSRIGFKVIEKSEDPRTFLTRLKLRQLGSNIGDGVLDGPESCILGFAKIDGCILAPGGDPCGTWNPSVVGAAQVDCTEIA